jgi:hypothetical protein
LVAIEIAIAAVVTVDMAAETKGTESGMLREKRSHGFASRGMIFE